MDPKTVGWVTYLRSQVNVRRKMFLTKTKADQRKQAIQENIPSGGHKFTGEMGLLLRKERVTIMNKSLCRRMSNVLLLIVFVLLPHEIVLPNLFHFEM